MKTQQYDLNGLKKFAALDDTERDIAIEVLKTGRETKVKFLEGIRLIKDKGMDVEGALTESGFAEAYKRELSQKKAPDTEPSHKDSSGA